MDYNKLLQENLRLKQMLEASQKKEQQLKQLKTKKPIVLPSQNIIQNRVFFNMKNKVKIISDLNTIIKNSNAELKVSKAKYQGRNVLEIHVDKKLTRNEIKAVGKNISTSLQKNRVKGFIETACQFTNAWRSGRQLTPIGADINIYEAGEYSSDYDRVFNDQNEINHTIFYVDVTNDLDDGGHDPNNDCFYNAIKKACPANFITKIWKTGGCLKKYLNLDRLAMISIQHIPAIETKMKKIGIHVSGDVVYTSLSNSKMNIHLKLLNNHYTINYKINAKCRSLYSEKEILLHDKLTKKGYNGVEFIDMTPEFFQDTYTFKNNYILVPRQTPKITHEEEYKLYIKLADDLKEYTNGRINLYKTGTIKKASVVLFDELTRHINAEHIEQDEAIWIKEATRGAIVFFENYEGEASKVDIVSNYPSILSDNHLMCPIKRGNFKQFTEQEFKDLKFYPTGIYHCNITPHSYPKINRLFRFSTYNKYTNISINHAITLGLTVEIIVEDNKPNALLYPRSHCITGHELFKSYVDYLFPMKEQGLHGAKLLLNILSGSIGEINEYKIYVDGYIENEEDDDFKLEEDYVVIKRTPIRNTHKTLYTVASNSNYFKSSFARIKPFMLARGRSNISDLILPYNDIVVKCNTDCIISTQTISEYALNKDELWKDGKLYSPKLYKMGELKEEYTNKHIKITSNAKEIFIN